jgi:ketosteroid isomerase-like protein
MPHANENTLRKLYDALGRGDVPTVLGLLADDVRYHIYGRSKVSGDYVGKDEVLGLVGKLVELSGGTFRIQVLDILANDEHGVVLTRETAQHDGKTLDNHAVHVWDVRGGICTRFRGYNEDAWDEFW